MHRSSVYSIPETSVCLFGQRARITIRIDGPENRIRGRGSAVVIARRTIITGTIAFGD